MKKNSLKLIALTLVLTLLAGCSKNGYPVKIGEATISKTPETVVCLSDSAASVIAALGYESYLTAAPESYQKAFDEKLSVAGDSIEPNMEKISELNPSLIIAAEVLSADDRETFDKKKLDYVVLDAPITYADLSPYYQNLAKIFEGEEKGTAAANTYLTQLESALGDIKNSISNKSTSVLVFADNNYVVTRDTLAGQLLEKAGFINAAGENFKNYQMAAADIAAANPSVIFCPIGSSKTVLSNAALKDVTAVKNGAVYEINVSELLYGGATLCNMFGDMANYL